MKFEAFGLKINTGDSLVNPNVKLLAVPVLSTSVFTILLIFAISTGYSKIITQNEDLEIAKKSEAILETKVQILRKIEDGILEYSDDSIVAMPDRNSSLWALVQVKRLAQKHNIDLSELSVSSQGGGVSLSLNLSGESGAVIDYLKEVRRLAPVMTLGEVSIDSGNGIGVFIASTSVTTTWADLPTELPPLTQPITDLNEKEKNLLDQIARLEHPEFTSLSPSGQTEERVDPFN